MWMVTQHLSPLIVVLLPSLGGFLSVTRSVQFRMDLLYMVSGFLAAYIYIANPGKVTLRAYGEFLRLRLIRLYPSYVAAVLFAVFFIGLAKGMNIRLTLNYSWVDIPANLTMLQAWPYLGMHVTPYNPGLWFISALWFACLFASPCAWILVHRLRKSWPTFLWVFAPVAVWLLVSQVASLENFWIVTRASCGLLCGSALFVLYATGSRFITAAQKSLDTTVLVFLLLSVLTSIVKSEASRCAINSLLVLGAPFLLAGTTTESSFTAKFFATRPMLWLGKISYSLFVSHDLCVKMLNHVLPASGCFNSFLPVRILVVLVCVALILAVAAAFHHLVEAPCTAALNRFSPTGKQGSSTRESLVIAGPQARPK